MSTLRIYALIIGTEILNRRRLDRHFDFVSTSLLSYGQKLIGSFVIEDDPALIVECIQFIASRPNSILLSFGGIGSTPDDHTRKCASLALRDGILYRHQEAEEIIRKALGDRISPHSYKMADLPKDSDLLHNPINNMPAFSLDNRFFFMPGFPEMSHPMTQEILFDLFGTPIQYYRNTLTADCRESFLIDIMEQMPPSVEFSSLPKLYKGEWRVSISVASHDEIEAQKAFGLYIEKLQKHDISYTLADDTHSSP